MTTLQIATETLPTHPSNLHKEFISFYNNRSVYMLLFSKAGMQKSYVLKNFQFTQYHYMFPKGF